MEAKLQIIADYLRRHFSDVSQAETAFRIGEVNLDVDPDFLDSHEASAIGPKLDAWQVAEEIRRSEGLPLVLTTSGIRLASSN